MSDIPSWAVRGAKCVCIDGDWNHPNNHVNDPHGLLSYPVQGSVYTIREVRVRFVPEWGEVMIGILLDEIRNPPVEGGSANGEEIGFDIHCFRPLIANQQKHDVSMFEHHLTDTKASERA